jgi:DNA adenine methylase
MLRQIFKNRKQILEGIKNNMFKKEHVEVIPVDYKYSFGNQKNKVGNNRNSVQEYLFLGY